MDNSRKLIPRKINSAKINSVNINSATNIPFKVFYLNIFMVTGNSKMQVPRGFLQRSAASLLRDPNQYITYILEFGHASWLFCPRWGLQRFHVATTINKFLLLMYIYFGQLWLPLFHVSFFFSPGCFPAFKLFFDFYSIIYTQ